MKRKWLTWAFYTVFLAFNISCCALWSLDPARHFRLRATSAPQVIGQTTGQAAQQATGQQTDQVTGQATGEASGSATDQAIDQATDQPTAIPLPARDQPPQSFNALILGLDGGGARTDVIMLANIDPVAKKVILLSIPRDTRVPVPGVGMTKINHAHYWGQSRGGNRSGTELAIEAVQELLGCEIRYYVKVDFEGYKNFIDTVGGVDIELPHKIVVNESDKFFPAGPQHLDGETALMLVRERFTLPDGEFGRQRLQYLVIASLAQKLLHPEYIPKLPKLASQVMNEVVDTNLSLTDALSLAILFEGMTASDITYFQVPGVEGYAHDPLVGKELFYWLPDPDGLRELVQLFDTDPAAEYHSEPAADGSPNHTLDRPIAPR